MAAAVYQVTAVAKDSQGATVTSSPIQVKISKALKSVRTTRKNATTLESALTAAGGGLAWLLIRNEIPGRAESCPAATLDRRYYCAVDGAPLATERDAVHATRPAA